MGLHNQGFEAFGLVLIEAQAHELPIVYSDLPGVREILGALAFPILLATHARWLWL
ncbi:glycosyltransferase [Streptomyces sp. GTA36]